MLKKMRAFRRFRRDEGGYSSAEFVVVATAFLTGFFWVFETGLIMTKQMMLERAVDMTVRKLRLYSNPLFTHDFIKKEICDLALIFKDCEKRLLLSLETVDLSTGYTKTYSCYDKKNDVAPVTTWNPGQRQEIIYMRACVIVDPLMPNGIALFPNVSDKGVPLVADTAFVNEPD